MHAAEAAGELLRLIYSLLGLVLLVGFFKESAS